LRKTKKKVKKYNERNIKKKVGVVGVIKMRASMKPHMPKTPERERENFVGIPPLTRYSLYFERYFRFFHYYKNLMFYY
jgi:hypothetical protein